MANYNKFDLSEYISFGYATYDEYYEAARDRDDDKNAIDLMVDDAISYLNLISNGYNFVLEDIQKILDNSSKNTIQVNIMKDIDKMYINKPVKDLLYLAIGKAYKRGISPFTEETRIYFDDLKLSYPKLIYLCKDLNLKPSFLIKRVFMKADDIENMIRELFKKEIVSYEVMPDGNQIKEISYVAISDNEMKLIMQGNLKSDKTLRNELGLSNLNQLQRRLEGRQRKALEKELMGYKGRFVMQNDGNKRPLVRYLFDPNVLKDENNKE